jgi:hypothetical protein
MGLVYADVDLTKGRWPLWRNMVGFGLIEVNYYKRFNMVH